ncbi:MAG: hypothetical protein ACR2G5_13120 [Pyrinomonadaceae bacterium]
MQRKTILTSFLLAAALLLGGLSIAAQKPNKFPNAIARSGDAARIVSLLAIVPDSGLPKEFTGLT